MFTNLDITGMGTSTNLFQRELIEAIGLKEERFGFQPEVTAKVARSRYLSLFSL
jgi:hypothetical protein